MGSGAVTGEEGAVMRRQGRGDESFGVVQNGDGTKSPGKFASPSSRFVE
jgi:hypothetical protein